MTDQTTHSRLLADRPAELQDKIDFIDRSIRMQAHAGNIAGIRRLYVKRLKALVCTIVSPTGGLRVRNTIQNLEDQTK